MVAKRDESNSLCDVRWRMSNERAESTPFTNIGPWICVLVLIAGGILGAQLGVNYLTADSRGPKAVAAMDELMGAVTDRGIVRIFEATAGQPAIIQRRNGSVDIKPALYDDSAMTPLAKLDEGDLVHRNSRTGNLVSVTSLGDFRWSSDFVANGFEGEMRVSESVGSLLDVIALPNNRAAYAVMNDGDVQYWSFENVGEQTATVVRTSLPLPRSPKCFAASSSGRLLVCTYSDGVWTLYDRTAGTVRTWSSSVSGSVTAIAWTPDDRKVLATGLAGECSLVDIEQQSLVWTKKLDGDDLLAVSIDSTGRYFAAGGVCKRLIIADVDSGDQVTTPLPHEGAIKTIAFSEDGRHLCTGSTDGGLRVWKTDTWQLAREVW